MRYFKLQKIEFKQLMIDMVFFFFFFILKLCKHGQYKKIIYSNSEFVKIYIQLENIR